jgi:hypothetical protein
MLYVRAGLLLLLSYCLSGMLSFTVLTHVCYGADERTLLIPKRSQTECLPNQSMNKGLCLLSYAGGIASLLDAWSALHYADSSTNNYDSISTVAASSIQVIMTGICMAGIYNIYQGKKKRLASALQIPPSPQLLEQAIDQQDCGGLLVGLSNFMQGDLLTYFFSLKPSTTCGLNIVTGVMQFTAPTYIWIKNYCGTRERSNLLQKPKTLNSFSV